MPDAAPEPPLEAALDELYGSDPGEFVAIRKRLASSLAAEGDTAAAKELRGARRPSTSAWGLNQLARRDPQVVSELLERSADLVAAQTRALSGRPDAMREAVHAHRVALDAATDAALEILGTRSNDAFRSEIVSTLRAASADEEIAARLRSGRLIREASSPGFPDATGLTLVPGPAPSKSKPSKRPASAARAAPAPAPVEDPRDAELAAEREREAKRQADRAAADRAAAAADRDAAQARARIEQLQSDLEVARHDLSAALARSRAAKKEAERLNRP